MSAPCSCGWRGNWRSPSASPKLDRFRTRALGLVRYHAYMPHDYLDLAFNGSLRRHRRDPHAVENGLDRPGAELRALRLTVRAAQDRYARPG